MIKYWTIEDVGADALKAEARRIECGLNETDRQMGLFPDEFDFTCQGNADEVLRKVRDVMAIVSDASLAGAWPTGAEWALRLPSWFVEACVPEDAKEEAEEIPWHELPPEERKVRFYANKWKLTDWTDWMEPDERAWLWWTAEVRDHNIIHVVIDRLGDPPPGLPPGFWWLFAASGAVEYDEA